MIRNLLTTITILFGLLFVDGVLAKSYGPVGASETLWHIASRNRPSYDVSTQQTMLAIRQANPNAFTASNVNSLKAGAVIRLPSIAEIEQINRSYALREVTQHNKNWKTKKSSSRSSRSSVSSNYKRHYKASQRELRKLQRRLKREKRKVRKLKEELAQLKGAPESSGDGTIKQVSSSTGTKTGSIAKLQEKVAKLEKVIEEKNVHIAQLKNVKTVASETIKKQQMENQTLFNKLKSIAPNEVLDQSAKTGSLQLTGVDQAAGSTLASVAQKASAPTTNTQAASTNRNNVFILVLSLLCILFIFALIWRVYSQKSARKNAITSDSQTANTSIDESEHTPSATSRKEPLLST